MLPEEEIVAIRLVHNQNNLFFINNIQLLRTERHFQLWEHMKYIYL